MVAKAARTSRAAKATKAARAAKRCVVLTIAVKRNTDSDSVVVGLQEGRGFSDLRFGVPFT